MLRAFGSVEVDTTRRALKTQLRTAQKKGAGVVVIIDDEPAGLVKWREMDAGTQTEVEDHRLKSYAADFSGKEDNG